MKKGIGLLVIFLSLLWIASCADDQASNATGPVAPSMTDLYKNNESWVGRYFAVLPCQDCDGMGTIIELNEDFSYVLKYSYLGNSSEIIEFKGYFEWVREEQIIRIGDPALGEKSSYYRISKDGLIQMKNEREDYPEAVLDDYTFEKMKIELALKEWSLVEMMGVNMEGVLNENNTYIIFNDTPSTLEGFGRCNSLVGNYQVVSQQKLQIDKLGSTRKNCKELNKEQAFLEILANAKFYQLSLDTLQLGKDSGVADLVFVYNPLKP